MARYDVYAVQADRETGLWVSDPESTGDTVDMAEWSARVDTESEHYDVYDRAPGDPLFGPAPETCAIIVHWIDAETKKSAVTFEGRTIDLTAARMLMDDELCDVIHGTVETEQAFLDAYLSAHAEKYGTSFVFA